MVQIKLFRVSPCGGYLDIDIATTSDYIFSSLILKHYKSENTFDVSSFLSGETNTETLRVDIDNIQMENEYKMFYATIGIT